MARPEPENGLVVRYDFLWRREEAQGQDHGAKDRPCVIVLTSKPLEDGSRKTVVCPITHTLPEDSDSSVEIPPKVAAHLNLDAQRSWIRTHEVNAFTWEKGRIPFGLMPARDDSWTFGHVPPKLFGQVRDQLMTNRKRLALKVVQRDRDKYREFR